MTDLLQDLPLLMLRAEVAKLFRMSERNVRRLEAQGRLRSLKLTPGRAGEGPVQARRRLAVPRRR